MKSLITGIFLLMLTHVAFGQSDFRAGYVIFPNGDVIKGQIDFKENSKNYQVCVFRNDPKSEIRKFSPNDLKGFGFEGDKRFESREIAADDGNSMEFLQVLVSGEITLFRDANNFYVEKEGKGFFQLNQKDVQKEIDGKTMISKSNKHIGILNLFLADCPDMAGRIPKLSLNEKQLTKLISDYHVCTEKTYTSYKAEKPWIRIEGGPMAGMHFSRMSVKSANVTNEIVNGTNDLVSSPLIGVNLDLFFPRLHERVSVTAGLNYTKSTYNLFHEGPVFDRTKRNFFTLSNQELKVPMGVRYHFPERNLTPFVSIGLSQTFNLNTQNLWAEEIESRNEIETFHHDNLLRSFQLGAWGSVGLSKNLSERMKGIVELRMEHTNGVYKGDPRSPIGMTSRVTNLQLVLGINFK
ncbi:outer membrane beta-barrel protein [Pararhodonellum marinum]|uniref:outer membrane beta-barrel protein n=1 Tax=Pararhodonellum marinum TaxID=2755358 RepID=UPI00188E8A76|nr:outer membrane beta-barrel protein [Pararhodonellum marinum]